VLGIGLAGLVLGTNSAARAGDDDDSPSVMGKIMETFGLRDPKGSYAGIDYNERSPLVVPPTRDLPPPEASTAPPAPNWPKDQDMIRRAKAKAEEKKVAPHPDAERARPGRCAEGQYADRQQRKREYGDVRSVRPQRQEKPVQRHILVEDRIHDIHRRTDAGNAHRSAGRLSHAVARSTLWRRPGARKLQGQDARRAGGADALDDRPGTG
jgi:hypothetical protein